MKGHEARRQAVRGKSQYLPQHVRLYVPARLASSTANMRENPAPGFCELQPVGQFKGIDTPFPLFHDPTCVLERQPGYRQMAEQVLRIEAWGPGRMPPRRKPADDDAAAPVALSPTGNRGQLIIRDLTNENQGPFTADRGYWWDLSVIPAHRPQPGGVPTPSNARPQ